MQSDALVLGGGLVGAATAYGLAREGLKVTVLDEGDVAFRAARQNFGPALGPGQGLGHAGLCRPDPALVGRLAGFRP